MIITAFIKFPGEVPDEIELPGDRAGLRALLGGEIEADFWGGLRVLSCRDAKRMGMEYNCRPGFAYYGTILFVGAEDDCGEFTDVPMEWDEFRRKFVELFREKIE